MLERTYIATNATSQIHTFGAGINWELDHWDNLDFASITDFSHGHHARSGGGSDTFNFQNISNVSSVIVGRLEDFDASRDEIRIEGELVDLGNPPSNVRIVEFNGSHNDADATPQQWMLISTPSGGQIFYALEGARVDMDGDGESNSNYHERHFIMEDQLPDFSLLSDVPYIDPQNFVPSGYEADGGITVNDIDEGLEDVLEVVEGSMEGDLIAAGLNNDVVRGFAGDDRIWGGSGNDSISGDGGNDTISGGNGHDTLRGGVGADDMLGGSGNDIYIVDDLADRIFEQSGEGRDHVDASISFALRSHSQHLETLTLTGDGDFNGTGNRQANVISGNSGDNILNGAWGNDVLIGGAGNDIFRDDGGADRMVGGRGDDTYRVDNSGDRIVETSGQGNDHVDASISFSLRDHSQHIETLSLIGGGDINGTGNGRANTIVGNGGDNILNGAWGNDVLIGGLGDDTFHDDGGADRMVGGNGNDTYRVDNAGDRVVEFNSQGNDHVDASISFSLRSHSQHLETLSLTGNNDINGTGNGLFNTIRGNDGNNILNGAWGNDILIGGGGNDIFRDDGGADQMVGGIGNDIYRVDHRGDQIVENHGQGNDHVDASVSFSLRSHSQHLETLTLTGTGSIAGTGNGRDNVIIGNRADNRLDGAWGDDTIDGAGGDDILTGGRGADTFIFSDGFGQDTITDFDLAQDGETIRLSSLSSISSFDDLMNNHIRTDGGEVFIFDGAGSTIHLQGVNVSELEADHFIF